MTQIELEQIASHIRDIGLHSSWNELIEFSDSIIGGLVEAYQTLLGDSTNLSNISATNPEDVYIMVRDRLARALTFLTSPTQVAMWKSEVPEGYTASESETPALGNKN